MFVSETLSRSSVVSCLLAWRFRDIVELFKRLVASRCVIKTILIKVNFLSSALRRCRHRRHRVPSLCSSEDKGLCFDGLKLFRPASGLDSTANKRTKERRRKGEVNARREVLISRDTASCKEALGEVGDIRILSEIFVDFLRSFSSITASRERKRETRSASSVPELFPPFSTEREARSLSISCSLYHRAPYSEAPFRTTSDLILSS